MKKFITTALFAATIALIFSLPFTVKAANAESRAGIVNVSSGNLNVRSAPSTTSGIVTSFPGGTLVTLTKKSGNWWQIEYGDGKYGYCYGSYIGVYGGNARAVNVGYGSLNVRSGPGTSYSRISQLYDGKTVVVLSESGGWSRILFDGVRLGYVSSRYLTDAVSASTGYRVMRLSVPDYKQTDTRWSGVTLGVSGKTIGKIGCATTAIAMMESYRAGYNIYPGTMAKRLKYTSSGSVYWPSDYTASYYSSDYLTRLYRLLEAGKPILFGGKNKYGGQHWIVITGYSGSGSLSPSG
ncbi:MAG: SH3 domain-containing protein, partial [Clostridia bacterium]|nr:SH3 domain-containing protein [Clostridia bacterium]